MKLFHAWFGPFNLFGRKLEWDVLTRAYLLHAVHPEHSSDGSGKWWKTTFVWYSPDGHPKSGPCHPRSRDWSPLKFPTSPDFVWFRAVGSVGAGIFSDQSWDGWFQGVNVGKSSSLTSHVWDIVQACWPVNFQIWLSVVGLLKNKERHMHESSQFHVYVCLLVRRSRVRGPCYSSRPDVRKVWGWHPNCCGSGFHSLFKRVESCWY